jgi:hypothetical protein
LADANRRSSLAVLPAHFLEETRFFEFVDETRLDKAFRIRVRFQGQVSGSNLEI